MHHVVIRVDRYPPDLDELISGSALFASSPEDGEGLTIAYIRPGNVEYYKYAADGVKLAGEIKKQVNIPVIGVGGILRLEQAESALEEGLVDMVAIGRALIADPELVTKTLEGRIEDVNECTSCMECFMPGDEPGVTCPLNDNL